MGSNYSALLHCVLFCFKTKKQFSFPSSKSTSSLNSFNGKFINSLRKNNLLKNIPTLHFYIKHLIGHICLLLCNLMFLFVSLCFIIYFCKYCFAFEHSFLIPCFVHYTIIGKLQPIYLFCMLTLYSFGFSSLDS